MIRNLIKDVLRPLVSFVSDERERMYSMLLSQRAMYKRNIYVENVRFLKYYFDVPDFASFSEQFKEIFVDEGYNFKSDTDHPVIIDCGSNIGMSCLYYKEIYPKAKIYAFEADAGLASIAKENLYNNNIYDVEVNNCAVWVNNEGVEFSGDGADGGSLYGNGEKCNVPSVRLKDILCKYSKIDFLKIDIEGAEYDVLQDCGESLGNVQNMFIEYHSFTDAEQLLGELLLILKKNDFRYYMQSISNRKKPLIANRTSAAMDLQINIWCFKK